MMELPKELKDQFPNEVLVQTHPNTPEGYRFLTNIGPGGEQYLENYRACPDRFVILGEAFDDKGRIIEGDVAVFVRKS
ncbi:TPA: hypothetical protein DIS60_03470 [Patescibacteria group bacterium]|nr:hypothetical protein [Patescibacteria group bacterium]